MVLFHLKQVVRRKRGNEAHDNPKGRYQQREKHSRAIVPIVVETLIRACNGQSSGGRLGKAAEQISAHSSDIADIISDVVCNCGWVIRGILRQVLFDLSHQISAHIGSLCVDPAAYSSKQGHCRASQSVSRHAIHHQRIVLNVLEIHGTVDKNQEAEEQQSNRSKEKPKHASPLEGHFESLPQRNHRTVGNLRIGCHCHFHSHVPCQ